MPDFTWDGWKTLVSIALAVIPAVVKFRAELTRAIDVLAEGVGLLALVFGVLLYTHTLPEWQRVQGNLPQLTQESPILAATHYQTIFILYTGSIALMVLGAMLGFSGLLGRIRGAVKRSQPSRSVPSRR